MSKSDLDKLFSPSTIAVVGASTEVGKPGWVIVKCLQESKGITGRKIFPVNPKTKEILGLPSYPSIADIPEDIDLAFISVPASMVPEVVTKCVEKKVKFLIIITSGFAESGPKGAELQERVVRNIEGSETRILGPNCLGLYNLTDQLNLTFASSLRGIDFAQGEVGFISQSGVLAIILMLLGNSMDIHFSKVISLGNTADIDAGEAVKYLAKDPHTKVIALYLESVRRGREFVEISKAVAKIKPIVAFKSGRSSSGARATSSHTGALAGLDAIYDAGFKQGGIIRVPTSRSLLQISKAFVSQPLPKGPRMAILTTSGGLAAEACDFCDDYGLRVSELSKETEIRLRQFLPPYLGIQNPIDIGPPDPRKGEMFVKSMETLVSSEDVDGVICISHGVDFDVLGGHIDKFPEIIRRHNKPVIAVGIPRNREAWDKAIAKFNEASIPCYDEPRVAVIAMASLFRYYKYLQESL